MTTRRIFLKHGGMALVSLGFAPAFLARTAWAGGRAARRKVLIAIFQRGGVDGLNMVVPFGEAAYYRSRRSIAIDRPGRDGGALDLDGFFGLHPRMEPLMPWWQRDSLAVIHATGSPDETRSHFDAQDYMESATPGVKSTRDGWLNRYLHAKEHERSTPFRAVALAPQLPRSLQGRAPALAIARLDQFGLRGGDGASLEADYAAAADQLLGRTGKDAFDAARALRAVDPVKYAPANGAAYPRSPYGESLRQIAQLIKADVGLEVAFAESGNWDHHANQGGAAGLMANRLDDLAAGIAALAADLGDAMADVVILTMSEFGRTVAENGNRGTDHGHGNAMLALGAGVKGGKVYGRWPGLEPEQLWQRRDLAITTDFRDVFAEVVTRHLGLADASAVFPGYPIEPSRFAGFMG